MEKSQIRIWPAFLATKEKLRDRFLFVGKVVDESNPSNFLFYLIEILSPWFPSTKVENIISQILEKNFKDTNFSLPEFEQTLREINESLGILSQDGENDWIGNLNALIGLVEDNSLHITLTGNVSGYLIRKNKVSSLTEGLSQDIETNPLKTFVNITSGDLTENDRIVIANLALYNYLSIERLRKIISELPSRAALFEIHRGLRRIKVKEASAVILEAKSTDPDQKVAELSEILYLDQAAKTWLEKSVEKAAPVAKKLYASMSFFLVSTAHKSGMAAKKAKTSWDKSYGPKTKEFLSKTGKKTAERIVNLKKENTATASASKFSTSNIKINSYGKKTPKATSKVGNFFIRVARTIQVVFRPENRRYLYFTLIVLLVLGGYFKIRTNNNSKSQISAAQQATASLDEANKLYSAGVEEIAQKKDSGKDKLIQALTIAKNAENFASTHDKATELKQKILDKIDSVIGAIRYKNLKPLYSINGDIVNNTLVGAKIYSVTKDGKIYATDTADKEPALVASIGQDAVNVIDSSYTDSLETIFISLNNQKLLTLDTSKDTVGKASITGDKNWEKGVALAAFNTNVYILDSETGEIWKHSHSDAGFSEGDNYLNTKNVSLKNGIDLSIDGNIYILNKDASIVKFIRGVPDLTFKVQAIPTPYNEIKEPKTIFTDQDTNYIYVFDKTENRIIRYDKTGAYSTQYIFEGISIDQFMINPRIQKMWVSSGKDIYEVSI